MLTERQRDVFSVPRQRQAGTALVDLAHREADGLNVARSSGRLEASLLELFGDVLGGALVSGRARVSSL
jgi:hypothetical protein